MTQINGKIYLAYGLEELTLLKCPYYQSNLQIQDNPYQNTHDIFHKTITNNPKICMEPQKTPNIKEILRKKKLMLSHSLVSNSTTAKVIKTLEQNKEPINKLTLTWASNVWKRDKNITMGETAS